MQTFNPEEYNDALQKAFTENMIDFNIPEMWYDWALKGLNFASPISLGVNAGTILEYYELLKEKKPLNYLQFSTIQNNLEKCSAKNLEMTLPAYCELMIEVGKLSVEWNKESEPIQKAVYESMIVKKSKGNNLKAN